MHAIIQHMSRAVAQPARGGVEICIAERCSTIAMECPVKFDKLLLVSKPSRSVREHGLAAPWKFAKQIYCRSAPSLRLESFFDTRLGEPGNIAHQLIEMIPLCLIARRELPGISFIFRPMAKRFVELLRYFGIDPLCTNRPVVGREAQYFLTRGFDKFPLGVSFHHPIYSMSGEVYSDYYRNFTSQKRIFISRRGERSLVNESQVISLLEKFDFETVYLEDYPIFRQIEIIQGADQIVAIHGAAIAFLTLKESTDTLIELFPPNVYNDFFPMALGSKIKRYKQLLPSLDDNVQFSGWPTVLAWKQKAFSVELDQLHRALQDL